MRKLFPLLLRLRRLRKRRIPKALKGPYPYTDKDGAFFSKLERSTEVRRCLQFLDDPNTTLVFAHGPSGAGVSSTMHAGVKYQLEQKAPAEQLLYCIYWAAVEVNPEAALVAVIEADRGISYSGSLANVLQAPTDRLVIVIDEFEKLKRTNPQHRPIFDFLCDVYKQPYPHRTQVVVAFESQYLPEWQAFQQEVGIRAPSITIPPLQLERAKKVMRTILNEANIHIGGGVADNYVNDMAEDGAVSPDAIAIGALAFSSWSEIKGGVKRPDYDAAERSKGVLKAYLRERLGWAHIVKEDSAPLLHAIVASLMTAPPRDERRVEGASVDEIAKEARIDAHRIEMYLQDLEDGRVLHSIPGSNLYTIAHDQWVPALRELDQELHQETAAAMQSIIETYQQWRRYQQRKYLVRGKQLRWLSKNEHTFLIGPDHINRTVYLRKSKTAAKWRRLRRIAIVLLLIALLLFSLRYWRRYRAHQQLSKSHLIAEIYDHQGQLESLSVDCVKFDDLNWLHSPQIADLSISGAVRSLDGLKSAKDVQDLKLFLTTSISVEAVSNLRNLKSLVIQGTQLPALPDLSAASSLRHLTINAKDGSITDLSPIASIPQLTDLELFLDRSKVQSLAPIANIEHLKTLHLSLDQNQLQLLSALRARQSPLTLTLDLQPSIGPKADVSHIGGLQGLTIQIPGANPGQIPNIVPAMQLQGLHLIIDGGSQTKELPAIEQLNTLSSLELNVESSQIPQLPNICTLSGLEWLSLNLSSTAITTLPKFECFENLKELHLILRNLKGGSLRGIDCLSKLQTLELDIRGANIADLDTIAKLSNLEKLVLSLQWSQVSDLKDLFSSLTKLRILELHIEGDWGIEALPRTVTDLHNLTELSLTVSGSHIERLPRLTSLIHLEKLAITVTDNSEMDLTELENITSVSELKLDFHRSAMRNMPNLSHITNLRKTVVDVSGSNIKGFSQLQTVPKLEELTIDQDFESAMGLPASVKKLRIACIGQ